MSPDDLFLDCVLEELRDGEEVSVRARSAADQRKITRALGKRGATKAEMGRLTFVNEEGEAAE